VPLRVSRPQTFPDDTNPLPTAGSREQAALLDDELEIGHEGYFERLQQFSDVTDNIYPELIRACRNVLAQVRPNEPLRVLDLCSGVGIVSLELLRSGLPIASISLADLSRELLGRAQALIAKRHPEILGRVDTVELDLLIHDLDSRLNGSYDLVVTCNAFQHFPRERQAQLFQQIQRLLKPLGVFVFESHFKLLRPGWKDYLITEYQTRLRDKGAPPAFVEQTAYHLHHFHNYINLFDAYNWLENAEFAFYECVFRKDEIGILVGVK
jgi:SAM-dependent methyltransferase